MKKILLASTAVFATAGVVAADVTVSGDGRMGIQYRQDGFGNELTGTQNDRDYNFNSRIRIKFTASGETDGGLAFGGSIRADNSGGGSSGTDGDVFVSGAFGTLAMGDVNGGAEEVVGDLAMISLAGLLDQNEFIYLFGAGRPNGLYSYSVEGLTLALGVSDNEAYAAGIGYDGGSWSIGLGYEGLPAGSDIDIEIDGDPVTAFSNIPNDANQLIGQATVTFAGFTVKGVYGQLETSTTNDIDQYGLSGEYDFDAVSVAAYWRRMDGWQGAQLAGGSVIQSDSFDQYGIGASYDLGGGAEVVAGIASVYSAADDKNDTVADFGLKFSF